MKNKKAFTLVEMVVTLLVIIILMSVSIPVYKGNTKNFKQAEGYALLATIRSAQERYYTEYGNFLMSSFGSGGDHTDASHAFFTVNEAVLGINARTNKYYTCFSINGASNIAGCFGTLPISLNKKFQFRAFVLGSEGGMCLDYNLTTGVRIGSF